MKRILPLIIILFTLSCRNAPFLSDTHPDPAGIKTLSRSISPDGKKLMTVKEICAEPNDTVNCHTQVFMDFGNTGSGVYAVAGINRGIKAKWKDNNTIVIETKKKYSPTQKWPKVQSFNQIVLVEYIEQ